VEAGKISFTRLQPLLVDEDLSNVFLTSEAGARKNCFYQRSHISGAVVFRAKALPKRTFSTLTIIFQFWERDEQKESPKKGTLILIICSHTKYAVEITMIEQYIHVRT
jgi:hypothetical protein